MNKTNVKNKKQEIKKQKSLQKKVNLKDKALWAGVAVISAAVLVLMYYIKLDGSMKALSGLIWLVSALALAFFTTKGQAVFEFMKAAQVELKKVVWPTRQETVQTTSIVVVMVGITGFMLWGVDSLMMWIIGKITHLS